MNIHYRAPVIYCKLFFLIFEVIFSIAKGVQHDGRLPFWKPASVYVRIVNVFAIGEINSSSWLDIPERVKYKLGVITRRCLYGSAPQYLYLRVAFRSRLPLDNIFVPLPAISW